MICQVASKTPYDMSYVLICHMPYDMSYLGARERRWPERAKTFFAYDMSVVVREFYVFLGGA